MKEQDISSVSNIICVAGGYESCGINEENVFDSIENMINMNFVSSLMAAHIGANFLE